MNTDGLIRQIALDLLSYGAQDFRSHGPTKLNRSIFEAYWTLMDLYKFGLLPIPIPGLDIPIHGPDPLPSQAHDLLLFELAGCVAGDPEPQPSLKVAFSSEVRLAAVKALRQRLGSAVKLADAEIARLLKQG